MKIQVGPKKELAWDVNVGALKKEDILEPAKSKKYVESKFDRCFAGCFDERLMYLLMLTTCIVSFYLFYVMTQYIPKSYYHGAHILYKNKDGKLYNMHFSWRNCGNETDPIKLRNLWLSPDPIHLDRNITVDLISSLDIDIDDDHPISADIKLERKVGWWWVKIPCFEEVGSCFYGDVCKVIPFSPSDPCPDPFPRFNVPCHCPIKHGAYNIKKGMFNLSAILEMFPIPHWLASGDYYGKVIASRKDKRMGCYEFQASVKA